MKVTLNGEATTLDAPCTIAELLRRRELADQPCAVEVNRDLVPRRAHAEHLLHDGDTIEIVTLVGGG